MGAKYTQKGKKCPCWWDITRKDCACCTKKEYQQCGWPMHKFCYKKEPKGKPQIGCPGVCNNQYTLSGRGFPCSSDHDNKDCAWCTSTGFQCAQEKVSRYISYWQCQCASGYKGNGIQCMDGNGTLS